VGVKRREFITLLGGAAVWPLTARAQTSKPVVGFLNSASPDLQPDRMRAFLQGLSGAGYVEGQNVQIEYRWAKNQFDRLPVLADELVRRQVDVIVTGYNVAAAKAAKTATKNIPIVFTSGVDPVRAGLVASLNQPGGNITGVNILTNELVPKHVELLHELVSGAKDIGLLVNPTNVGSAEAMSKDAKTASDKIGVQLHVLHASKMEDFEKAFGDLRRLQTSTLTLPPIRCMAAIMKCWRHWRFAKPSQRFRHFEITLLLAAS
jgi:putative ABC transport system substrate-binding protein